MQYGISDENTLKLAKRTNGAAAIWSDTEAKLDPDDNTLTKSGESGTEYILGTTSSDNSLPVELSTFTAASSDGKVILHWRTETEVGNIGFSVYRTQEEKYGNYTEIAFVKGAGDSGMPIDYQFIDKKAEAGKTYFYYIEDVDIEGVKNKSEIIKVIVPPAKPIPKEFRLLQNFPNPFNPETWIAYELPKAAPVVISIYSIRGELIRQLNLGEQKAGYYIAKDKAAHWDGRNYCGEKVTSGVYFYRLQAGKFNAIRRMVILK